MKIKDKKKFKRAVIATIVILLIFILVILIIKSNKKYDDIGDFKDVKEVLEYLGCDYIRTGSTKDENYDKNVFVKFNRDLYENEESNERFFNNLVEMVTVVNKYKSIMLTDEEREIVIKILCDESNNQLETYYINDIENYFDKQDSINSMNNILDEKITNLTVNSDILQKSIKAKWITNDIDFGSKDSEFDGYEIYADEGIKIKKVSNKVFNIVFEKDYESDVVNNIKVGTDIEEVKNQLGDPTYKSETEDIIGYKNEDFYIFFTENQISVYRNDTSYNENFYKLVERFADEEIEFQEFINELTTLWTEYDEYSNTEQYYKLTYSLKGVSVEVTTENKDGIHIYSNYTGLQKGEDWQKFIETDRVKLHADENLVYETEFKRVNGEKSLSYVCQDYMSKMEQGKPKSNLFYYNVVRDDEDKITKVMFLSVDGTNLNSELNESINSYIWYNDTIFLYGKPQDGIYAYDAVNRQSRKILSGTDNFEIKGIEENRLMYDDKSVKLTD